MMEETWRGTKPPAQARMNDNVWECTTVNFYFGCLDLGLWKSFASTLDSAKNNPSTCHACFIFKPPPYPWQQDAAFPNRASIKLDNRLNTLPLPLLCLC